MLEWAFRLVVGGSAGTWLDLAVAVKLDLWKQYSLVLDALLNDLMVDGSPTGLSCWLDLVTVMFVRSCGRSCRARIVQ